MPKNSTISTLRLDKSKLHDESILSFTAQGSEVASLRRRKIKSVLKARIELKPRSFQQHNFTQLSENSVTSKKTAYNFAQYVKSISPLKEFPKLVFESILSFTAQGSKVASLRRRKTKSLSKSRIELKPRSFQEHNFTQLSENSVTSKKTAYNFAPYIKSISPLKEFPKLVFESAQCITCLNTASLKDDDVCQMMQSIYDNIHHLKKVFDELEKNSELIRKELGLPSLCINEIVTGCSTVPNKNFNPTDFINTYGNRPSFKIERKRSLANRYFKNERQNAVSPITNFSKESAEEKPSMLPFETNLLLIDSILLRLQNTYHSVQREVSSWSTVHETDSTGPKFKSGSLSAADDDCLANARKCLLKYKDRRGSTSVKGIGRRFSDSGCSFSLINNEIRRITGKVSSAEKNCSFSEKGFNTISSVAKYYENVWILSSSDSEEVDGQVDNEISNDTVKISSAENGSLSKNSNCILKFKGRHATSSRRKYNDFDSSSSDSDEMTGQTKNESNNQSERASPVEIWSSLNKGGQTETSEGSHYDCVKISSYSDELNEPTVDKMDESEVDDSESSLEGSFKNFSRSSRLVSPISSGDDPDDSSADDVPRFSLPPPKSNAKKFYSKKTEFLEQVSCKEWSLKKGGTEISFKCTQRGRRFRSDELCAGDSLGIQEEFQPDDFRIPSDLLQDFSQFTTIK